MDVCSEVVDYTIESGVRDRYVCRFNFNRLYNDVLEVEVDFPNR